MSLLPTGQIRSVQITQVQGIMTSSFVQLEDGRKSRLFFFFNTGSGLLVHVQDLQGQGYGFHCPVVSEIALLSEATPATLSAQKDPEPKVAHYGLPISVFQCLEYNLTPQESFIGFPQSFLLSSDIP